ncbi:hypothetical protein [Tenuibacillus multivorans]|uniref:Uncharacterized protein n=1 Tax=Tenuibacillus multivorans TaxID=237069 RepID=A0A1H0FQ50_9BACI|nr:hypothetical protein [Tenuibacillus multivorans]GEL77930.1 hypothetical protein TMU01_21650 [Tenuibacillus multivorans]SDN96757.1 hypothetical protein SAMN05216498_0314 [Tenuibacillus multivorans]
MKSFMTYVLIAAIIFVIIPISLAKVSAETEIITISKHDHHLEFHKQLAGKVNVQASSTLTEAQVVSITEKFMDHLVQDVDEDYRVQNYQSMESYKDSFKQLASQKVVDMYVDMFYEEKGQALYIIPTETPPWFVEGNEYELEQLDEQTYRVTQTNDLELYGTYTIMIDLKLNDNGEPYIINVQYQ